MAKLLPKVLECQNCGTPTNLNFCPACGQDCRDYKVSVRLLLKDFAADVFTYDSRFFRSFIPLCFKPGALTDEYTKGRRVRFIPPLRLYVFLSLLFFFVVSVQLNNKLRESGFYEEKSNEPDSTLVARVLDLAASAPDTLDGQGEVANWVAEKLPAIGGQAFEPPADGDWANVDWDNIDWDENTQDDDTINFTSFGEEQEVDEKDFVTSIMKLVPKLIFLILPVFAGLLALVYLRMHRNFIEHLVFSLHLHAFMFLLFTLVMLIGNIWVALAAYPIIHIYLFLALRRYYRQGWIKTTLKFFFLTSSYNFTLTTLTVLIILSTAKLLEYSKEHPLLVQWILG